MLAQVTMPVLPKRLGMVGQMPTEAPGTDARTAMIRWLRAVSRPCDARPAFKVPTLGSNLKG